MIYLFQNVRHLIGDLAEEGQRIEARGDLQDDMAAIARGRAFLEIAARLEDTHIGTSALTAQPLMDAEAPGSAHSGSLKAEGALASIIVDPDCCVASKAIARDAIRHIRGTNGDSASDMERSS